MKICLSKLCKSSKSLICPSQIVVLYLALKEMGGLMTNKLIEQNYEEDVKILADQADKIIISSVRKVRHEHIMMNWRLGEMVNTFKIMNNSKYGDKVVLGFCQQMVLKYGSGYSRRNIDYMRKFNKIFKITQTSAQSTQTKSEQIGAAPHLLENEQIGPPAAQSLDSVESDLKNAQNQLQSEQIAQPAAQSYEIYKEHIIVYDSHELFKNLTWSHIREILSVNAPEKLIFYIDEINIKKLTKNDIRDLVKSKGFERTLANQREKIDNEVEKTIKNPIILRIKDKKRSEKELEDEIVENIINFMRELGNNVTYRARQYKININDVYHTVDLVFFDLDTMTYILIDLKINKVNNHDIMQMKLYTKYFAKEAKDYNVVGLILCETNDLRMVDDKDIYQIRYLNELPKEEELLKIINENKIILLKSENLTPKVED